MSHQVCWCGHNDYQHREGPCLLCAAVRIPSYGVCSRFTYRWEMDWGIAAAREYEGLEFGQIADCFCGHPLSHHGPNATLRHCEREGCNCPHFILLHHDRWITIQNTKRERIWPELLKLEEWA